MEIESTMQFTPLKHTVQWLLVYLQSCVPTTVSFCTFSSPPRETLNLLAVTPRSPPGPPGPGHYRSPCFMGLRVHGVSWKWNQAMRSFLWLASSIDHIIIQVRPHGSIYQPFIPFSCQITDYIVWYTTFYLFISADDQLSSFHSWATRSNAVVTIRSRCAYRMCTSCVDTCLQFPCVCAWERDCWSYGSSTFNVLRTCQAVSQSSCTIWHPQPAGDEASSFSISWPTLVFICLLYYLHL